MPEGDTVWLTAKRLNSALAGQLLCTFDLRVPTLATVDRRGDHVQSVLARGKHLLVRLDSELTLRSHLRMDGSWRLSPAGGATPGPRHQVRAILGNAQWQATGLRLHDLAIVPTAAEHTLVGHLGPDLLGPDWSADRAVELLRQEPNREIGDAIMDQRNLAGIGNLYKSETLFLRGVDPWTPVGLVDDLNALVTRAQVLLNANKQHPEQSTTGLLARGQQHWVYLRANEPCRRCRTPIQQSMQGRPGQERSTYWCPHCQPSVA
ncbi:DNA-formamidopyrimidine glycosylase family protein [Jatrophihabitans sp. GAS493]|uniref:DNA-formamidopyrimidine glycosylase family protein n=1 Tax=Jatrophihabitans sp. GAS493 TaxID=1907575 RepID=UPI000BB8B822|nr:DNA-formamidopyrimidine glycosylase family protein [Jatrophihabitans sp. GAS493]